MLLFHLFSAIFTKVNNFGDFLFASEAKKPFQKEVYSKIFLLEETILSLRPDPHRKGRKNDRAAGPERVPVYLKINFTKTFAKIKFLQIVYSL